MEQSDFVHTGQKVGSRHGRVRRRRRPWRRRCRSARGRTRASSPGSSTGSHYLLALSAQDVIDVVAPARRRPWPVFPDALVRGASPLGRGPRLRAGDGAAGTRPRGIPRPPGRRDGQGRPPAAGAWRMGATALCGTVLIGATAGVRRLDRALGADGRLAALPLSIPVGLATSAVIERARRVRHRRRHVDAAGDVATTVERARRRRRRPRGALRRRLGRAVDRRAGAPTRPGADARCRARLAGSPRTRRSRPAPASPSARCGLGPCSGSRP